jgi:hypothetical protein
MAKIISFFGTLANLILAWLFLSLEPASASSVVALPLVLNRTDNGAGVTIINNCSFAIWLQQSKEQWLPNTPLIHRLESKQSFYYPSAPQGIKSNRFWPKWGCNDQGMDCLWGQSRGGNGGPDDYPPCPAGGCHPAADTLVEFTWGCAYPDPGHNPLCQHQKPDTYYDISLVDGYSLPVKITQPGIETVSCKNVDCSGLIMDACPKTEDLSHGNENQAITYPEFSSVNLKAANKGEPAACFSTCAYLTQSALHPFGGEHFLPADPQAYMYCCPFEDAEKCRQGPVTSTRYVDLIHAQCPKAYSFAYDDNHGNFNCNYTTRFTVTYCPAQQ